jgi:predicted Zn finger-like uncharacterized protein
MIIDCKNCQTNYRLDETLVPDEGRAVRCSKCKSIYWIRKPVPVEKVNPTIQSTSKNSSEIEGGKSYTSANQGSRATLESQIHRARKDGIAHGRQDRHYAEGEEVVRDRRLLQLAREKIQKNIGWILLCVASSCLTCFLFDFAILSSRALLVGLIASFLGLFYLFIDKIRFELREILLVFGWGLFIGTFLRAISLS